MKTKCWLRTGHQAALLDSVIQILNIPYSNASMVNKGFKKKTSGQQAKLSQYFTADKQMVNEAKHIIC